jgi:formate dehydrogenase iron-sulfur subunit
MPAAILTDLTRCIGCKACVWACKEINDLPREDGGAELSAVTWTTVESRKGVYIRRQCMHCNDPACASVCPVGALHKTNEGPVVYDASKCMGCRYCMVGCPFGVPKYEWGSALPLVRKCGMCFENRIRGGAEPACTAVCPAKATVFGERSELIREAQRRIAAEPSRYVDHVYGEFEAGGTSVLYLSSVPFERLGFRVIGRDDPYPRLTWSILSKLPNVVSVGGVLMLGTWWIIRRRQTLMGGEGREQESPDPPETPQEGTRDAS